MSNRATEQGAAGSRGVRGWLLFFCIALSAGLLASLVLLVLRLARWVPIAGQYAEHVLFLTVEATLAVGLVALGAYAASLLWRPAPPAVSWAKAYLIAFLLCSAFFVPVPFLLGGGDAGGRVTMLQIARPFLGALLATALWFSYLAKSRRVGATYGAAPVESAVRRRLARTTDLGDALAQRRGGMSWLTALGYLAAALLSLQIHPTLQFLAAPAVAGPHGGQVYVADLLGLLYGAAVLLVELPSALLFAALLARPLPAWQRIAAWSAASALLGGVRHGVLSVGLPLLTELFQAAGSVDLQLTSAAALRTALWGGLSGALFMAGLVLAVRRWGLRWWSLAAGLAFSGAVEWLAGAVLSGRGLGLDAPLVYTAVTSLLFATLIWGALFLHGVRDANAHPDAAGAPAAR